MAFIFLPGPWEVDYSYDGEADLHRHYGKCRKNSGHKNFIPVENFSMEDLPEYYRHNDVFNRILTVSELTVRVTVKTVSGKTTVGTGYVVDLRMCPCECNKCKISSTPVMKYAKIHIRTASHVVKDYKRIMCHLFFDRGNTPKTCRGVVNLTRRNGLVMYDINDICHITYITHDLVVADRLEQTITLLRQLESSCEELFPRIFEYKRVEVDPDRQPLLFIVSHPHGCSKQVSLGRWTRAEMLNNVIVSIMYNTVTCRGSSGAWVCAIPAFVGHPQADGSCIASGIRLEGVHCGNSDLQRDLNLNFCHSEIGVPAPKFISLKLLSLNKGPWRDNLFCLMEDDDTNKHYAACKRNPGHRHFFPLEKINTDDLSPFNGRDETYIKLLGNLTVRVTVNYVSEKRLEIVPGTDIPCPWYSNRGSKLMRVGSGFISCIINMRGNDFPFNKCKHSPKLQGQCAHIMIRTAIDLVYDELEADDTTCDLFFNFGETPDDCKDVVTLTDACSFDKSNDTCTFMYCTDDMHLVCRLDNMLNEYSDNFRSLDWHANVKSTEIVNQNCGENTKQEIPFNIVISHPHGCAKQVSIGYCDNPGNDGTEEGQCSIGDIVCPGSIGAPVFLLSPRLFYPCV